MEMKQLEKLEKILATTIFLFGICVTGYSYFHVVPEGNRQIQLEKAKLEEKIKRGEYQINRIQIDPLELITDSRNTKFINMSYIGEGLGLLGIGAGASILYKHRRK